MHVTPFLSLSLILYCTFIPEALQHLVFSQQLNEDAQSRHAPAFAAPRPSLIYGNPAAFKIWEAAYLAGCLWCWCSWNLGLFLAQPPSILSLPVLIPHAGWDRSARLFPSTGVDRQSPVYPLSVVISGGARGGEEALTESDRSKRRPGPVHHLSAHAHWVPDSSFNAAHHMGQLPAPSVSMVLATTSVFFFHLIKSLWVTFLWKSWNNAASCDWFISRMTGTEMFPLYKQKIKSKTKERQVEVCQKTGMWKDSFIL